MVTQHTLDGLFQCLISNHLTLLWSNTAHINLTTVSEGHPLRTVTIVMMCACTTNKPLQLQVVECLKEILVVNLKASFFQSLISNPCVLIVVAHLIGMRVQSAVGCDDTITVKVVVAGRIAAIVATVSKYLLTSNLTLIAHTLVHEVPDITTLVVRLLANQVPVLFESTHRVTHGMSILTLNQWLLNLTASHLALRVFLAPVIVGIHGAVDICSTLDACTLILAWTCLIVCLHPSVSLLKVSTVTSLVTQAPHNNAGVVLIGNHVTLLTLNVSLLKIRTDSQCLLIVTHTMALQVALSSQVDTILIAQVIPTWIVGIVTGTHSIDVQLLHNLDILNHAIHAHDVATIRIQFVAVGTLNQDSLTVHQQLSALNLNMAETNLLLDNLKCLVALLQIYK